MIRCRKLATASLAAALALSNAACAPQARQQGGMSSGMSGMQGHDMAGMDMQTMMNHCSQMRQQRAQGQRLSPDMQPMMAECDQMDHGTGASASPMPNATRSR